MCVFVCVSHVSCVFVRREPCSDQTSETSSTDGNSRDSDFFQPPLKKVKQLQTAQFSDVMKPNAPPDE